MEIESIMVMVPAGFNLPVCCFCRQPGAETFDMARTWYGITYHQKCAEQHSEKCAHCGRTFNVLQMRIPYTHCDAWHCIECRDKFHPRG